MLAPAAVLGSVLLVAAAAAGVTRLSLARAFLLVGSAFALLLSAITRNVVGGMGLEVTVVVSAAVIDVLANVTASRRRRKAIRLREARQVARTAAEREHSRAA